MAKRRENGEGTIFYEKDRNRYRVQLSTGNGKRISKRFKTRQEAIEWRDKTNKEVRGGLTAEAYNITLEEFLSEWIKTKTDVKPKVQNQYNHLIHTYLIPEIGKIKLRAIKPLRLIHLYQQEFINSKGEPVGKRTFELIHQVLHMAFSDAVTWEYIDTNPASGLKSKIPDKKADRIRKAKKASRGDEVFLDASQAKLLLRTVLSEKRELYALYATGFNTSLRQGELLGLMWSDLDKDAKTLKVVRQVKRKPGGGFSFEETKTKAIREIPLGDAMLSILAAHWEHQQLRKDFAGENWQEYDLIFTTSIGTPIHPSKILKWHYELLEIAGLPRVTFHGLRHSAISIMAGENIATVNIQSRAGHASRDMTERYSHPITEKDIEAAEILDVMLFSDDPEMVAPKLHPFDPQKNKSNSSHPPYIGD